MEVIVYRVTDGAYTTGVITESTGCQSVGRERVEAPLQYDTGFMVDVGREWEVHMSVRWERLQ